MTTTATAPPRPSPWFDAAVVGVSAAVLASIVAFGATPAATLALVAALAVFLLTWFLVGRRTVVDERAWPVVIPIVVAVCAVGALVSPAFATFQVVAYPIVWLASPGPRIAVAANVAVALAIGVGYAMNGTVLDAITVGGVSLAFSLAMGAWITRIESRSTSRQLLVDELTAAQSQLAALHRERGAQEERERLARELHDTLTQSLTGIAMLAERAKSRHPDDAGLAALEDAARQSLAEARGLIAANAPVALDDGLAGALGALATRFRRETGLDVEVAVEASVPRELEVVLLRCAQEGLANVRKHADAAVVRVRVAQEGDGVVLTVEDDGAGPTGGQGFGIAGMRDRLALVGGEVALRTGASGGAVLAARVPNAGTAS